MIITGHIGPIHFKDLRPFKRIARPEDWRVPRMAYAELLAFVRDVCDDKIFLAQQVVPFEDVGCVFPAVAWLCEVNNRDANREIGTFFERRELACGKARNGQPSFQTVQFIHREDWLLARDLIAAELLRRDKERQS